MKGGIFISINKVSKCVFIILATIFLTWSLITPNSFEPWRNGEHQIAVTLGLFLLYFSNNELKSNTKHTATVLFLIPLIVIIHQALSQKNNPLFISYFSEFCTVFWSAAIGYLIGKNKNKDIEIIVLFTISAAGSLLAIIAIIQWIGLDFSNSQIKPIADLLVKSTTPGTRTQSNLGQPNNFGTLLIWTTCAIIHLSNKVYKISSIFISIPLILLIGFCIALSESRTTFLNIIIINIFFLFSQQKKYSTWKINFIALLVISSASWFFAPYLYEFLTLEPTQYLHSSFTRDGGNRLDFWRFLVTAVFPENPLGMGLGGVAYANYLYADQLEFNPRGLFTGAHNILLDTITTFGIIGLISSSLVVYHLINIFKSKKPDGHAFKIIILTAAVHASLELPHFYGYLMWIVGFSIGSLAKSAQSNKISSSITNKLTVTATVIVSLIYCQQYLEVQYTWKTTSDNNKYTETSISKIQQILFNHQIIQAKLLFDYDFKEEEIISARVLAERLPHKINLLKISKILPKPDGEKYLHICSIIYNSTECKP